MAEMKIVPNKEKVKILMVDDRPQNLVALDRVLGCFDVELVKATSGNEALIHIIKNDFALALLDVQMPEMDGYELAEIIRSDPDTAKLPIIFISAIFTDRLNIFKGYEKGAFSFITKPFDPLELQNKVRFFIQKFETEKAFEESQTKIVELYNSSPEMLLSINLENQTIIACNNTLSKISGYSKEELFDMPILKLFSKNQKEKVEAILSSFALTGETENQELTITKSNKQLVDIVWKASVIKNNRGEIIAANSSWTDVTEKNKLNGQLQLRNDELESFVYLTSHQLQEPTLTIYSMLDLLQEEYKDKIDSDGQLYIKYTIEASDRMRAQVKGMLNYLRIGREGEFKLVSLDDVLKRALLEMKDLIMDSGASITSSDLPEIKGSEEHLTTLFSCLISNAIKFAKVNQKPQIEIKATVDTGMCTLTFKDNGIGILAGHQKKIFKMFQQLHKRGDYEGWGVGLAMAKKIVEMHQGTISLESEIEKGTTFTVELKTHM